MPLERDRPLDRPEGEVAVTGFVRAADRRDWLSPTDDAPGRRFYSFDPQAIGAALRLSEPPAPFGLVALALRRRAARAPCPKPRASLPRPNNPHLGYAITWYGLAVSLVGVFVAFARQRITGDDSA